MMDGREEALCQYVEYDDIDNVKRLLDEDVNPAVIASYGKTAIGIACIHKRPHILELLLQACDSYIIPNERANVNETKKLKRQDDAATGNDGNHTPDGMDDLQWEDEIELSNTQPVNETTVDDEWSVLYRYYASIIEKTGEMLADTLSIREPHCLDAFQNAPIHYAAMVGDYECLRLLLRYSAAIDTSNGMGYTALHLAVEQPNIVELLLRFKADPNKFTFYDQITPLHMAARVGAVETIDLLHEAGGNMNLTTTADQTPLHMAICEQRYNAAAKLIQYGAKVNVQDDKGTTPLYSAIVVNDCRMVKLLLDNGARLLPSQYMLCFTIRNRMTIMTRLLIDAGASVNGRDPIGWTPLLLAINACDVDSMEYLIAHGAKINNNDYVLKELHIAVQQSYSIEIFKQMFKILSLNGVEIDSLNRWGETPLCLAMLREKYDVARFLIMEGADVNAGSAIKAKDCKLLMRDCRNIGIIELFLNAGMLIDWSEFWRLLRCHRSQLQFTNFPEFPRNPLFPFDPPQNPIEPPCSTNKYKLYLRNALAKPLSLKQMSRIVIRKRITENMKRMDIIKQFVWSSKHYKKIELSHGERTDSLQNSQLTSNRIRQTTSILECLIWEIEEIPVILHQYLYSFPDLLHSDN